MTQTDGTAAADFDPFRKERELREESESWDTSAAQPARDGDIPVIDLSAYFSTGTDAALKDAADRFRMACEEVGFLAVIGHGVPQSEIDAMFAMVRRFHALAPETKQTLRMDRADWPLGGVGYLPVRNRKLPTRTVGNYNEAFVIKRDHRTAFGENQWPERRTRCPGSANRLNAMPG